MDSKKLPLIINIGLTKRELHISFKKYIHELSIDIPFENFGLLFLADFKEDLTQQDIADYMKKDKSAILRQIDNLEEKGLVKRVVDSQDRRRNILTITDKGKDFIKEIVEIEKKLFVDLQKDISSQDMDTFNRVLLQLRNNSEKI